VSDDFYHDDPIDKRTTKKFPSKLLSSISLIIASVFFFQTTFAGNITLNSNSGIEFGQGFSQTVACSGSNNLTITPNSTFANASGGGGTYNFSSVTVSGIPVSCDGAQFQINAYGNTDQSPLALYNSTTTDVIVADTSNTFRLDTRASGITLTTNSASSFTVTFDTPVATSASVFKLTVQSSTNSIQSGYQLGDTGPGGGTIFYVALSPFACGPTRSATCTYLEAAPSGWNGGAEPSRTWAQSTPVNYQSTSINNASSPETATATAIGWGYRNTRAIILQGNSDTATSAAALTDSYTVTVSGVEYDDWYLPSKDELNQMCKWQRGVAWISDATVCSGGITNSGTGAAGFVVNEYGSSTEGGADRAWGQLPGRQVNYFKNQSNYVRPIRAF
jgi:hypothetical protein